MVTNLLYNKGMIEAFFNMFFIGVNGTFFPIHIIGLQGCPRKYRAVADRYILWTGVSSFSSVISVFRIWIFIRAITRRLIVNHILL